MNKLQTEFNQKYSITAQLRNLMISIVVFIVLTFLGTFFSSTTYLDKLQQIEQTNEVISLLNQTLDILGTSTASIEKISTSSDLPNVQFAFKTSFNILSSHLRAAILKAKSKPQVLTHLEKAQQTSLLLEESVMNSFSKQIKAFESKNPQDRADVEVELVVVRQYNTETTEQIRKAQIQLRNHSDVIFRQVFSNRFVPLQVAIGIAALFLIYILFVGFKISKKIITSLTNLTEATKRIKQGDLTQETPILYADELGNLTFSFNQMVKSVKEKQEEIKLTLNRIKRLQNITASFSEALTVKQVCEVTIESIHQSLNANYGIISILDSDRSELEIKCFSGYPEQDIGAILHRFPLNLKAPSSDSVRYQQAIFIENKEELYAKYPKLIENFERYRIESVAAVPLVIGSACLGGFSFHFSRPVKFSQEERDFIIAIAGQCAQAIHRSQLYDEAKENITSRDEFISIASHELKTPLTPLKLQLQMLHKQMEKGNMDALAPEKVSKFIDTANNQIKRMSKLIEDLLDVSKITLGKLTLSLQPLDVSEVIQEVVSHYGHQLKNHLQDVKLDLSPNLKINADKLRIEQVLINLLTNAVKYAPGKPINVSSQKKDSVVQIIVTDQGPGIAKENQKRIFNRFERVRDRDNVGGLGLGLYISSQIVEAHQGKIWVESELGRGASFVVELPLADTEKG